MKRGYGIQIAVGFVLAISCSATFAQSNAGQAAAGTAAGLVGIGFLNEALTHSSLRVTVEVFRDSDLGIPFQLDGPVAQRRALENGPIGIGVLENIVEKCAGPMQQWEDQNKGLAQVRAQISAVPASRELETVVHYLDARIQEGDKGLAAWREFSTGLDTAELDHVVTGEERAKVQEGLKRFRTALETAQVEKLLPEEWLILVRSQIMATFIDSDAAAKAPAALPTFEKSAAKTQPGAGPAAQLAVILDAARLLAEKAGGTQIFDELFRKRGVGLKTQSL